ncbi:undecaprenyl-phosphate glucose phosphotransferase [Roseospira navarrensis]|nr:undecaprenyl-phosphate glucose phosphotransferase [Roseospira navarrensis]
MLRSLHFIVFCADLVVLCGAGLGLYHVYGIFDGFLLYYVGMVFAVAAAFVTQATVLKLYDWRFFRLNAARMAPTFWAVLFAFGAGLLIAFALKTTNYYSRLWGVSWVLSFMAYIVVSRAVLMGYFGFAERRGYAARKAVIVGAGEIGRDVLAHFRKFGSQGIDVIGFLDDRMERTDPVVGGLPVLGDTSRIEDLVRTGAIDLIILALPWSAYQRIAGLVQAFAMWPVDIYMAPDCLGLRFADRPVYRIGGMHVLSLKDRPISDWNAVIKRAEDLAIAVPALILLSPLLALTALAIRLESRGSVLFVQKRYGFSNNLIPVYKFRSMYQDKTDPGAATLTQVNDARVTRVGAFIRRTSIDELPQLFNVIQGTMSVVGPRPHAVEAKAGGRLYEEVVAPYASRHQVKPGITGWAQCHGLRGNTDTEDKIIARVEHDLYYVENWSLYLDLVIILKTAVQIVRGDDNAY